MSKRKKIIKRETAQSKDKSNSTLKVQCDEQIDKPSQKYRDEKWVAIRLGFSIKTLQNWRTNGQGPEFYKIGRLVRYRLRDVYKFEKACRRNNTSDDGDIDGALA